MYAYCGHHEDPAGIDTKRHVMHSKRISSSLAARSASSASVVMRLAVSTLVSGPPTAVRDNKTVEDRRIDAGAMVRLLPLVAGPNTVGPIPLEDCRQ